MPAERFWAFTITHGAFPCRPRCDEARLPKPHKRLVVAEPSIEDVAGPPVFALRSPQGSLDWHVGLHCLRTQVEVAGWEAVGDIGNKVGHPWLTNRAAFARRVSELTGVDVATA